MPSTNELLVLILRDAGLRSTLVGRLSMEGADIYTANGVDSPGQSSTPGGLLLVLDEDALKDAPAPIEALLADGRWGRVVVVSARPSEPQLSGVIHVPAPSAPARIVELLRGWRAGPGSGGP